MAKRWMRGPIGTRDHVLLQPFVVANAGVAAGGQHVHEAVLGGDFQLDVGIGRQEGWHDTGQYKPSRTDRHIEPERARGPVAEAVHHVHRGFHLTQGRAEPFQQTGACLGRQDAARGAMEEPDARAWPPIAALPRSGPTHWRRRRVRRRGSPRHARPRGTPGDRQDRPALFAIPHKIVQILPSYRAGKQDIS